MRRNALVISGITRYVLFAALSAIATLVFHPSPVHASTVAAVSERELVAMAHAIVVGTVVRTEFVVTAPGVVVTRVEVEVDQGLAGAADGDRIIVEVPGGLLPNGLRLSVSGAPTLQPGQLIVGFLQRQMVQATSARRGNVMAQRRVGAAGTPVFLPLGLATGIMYVQSDARGALMAQRDLSGVTMVHPYNQHVAHNLMQQAQNAEALDTVLQRIRKQLAESRNQGAQP